MGETKSQNKRETGSHYELLAADYLKARGYRILEHNYRCRLGEIDLIGVHDGILVFIEVKSRRSSICGHAEDAVHPKKQRTIYKVASYYMMTHKIAEDQPCRFDVIAMEAGHLKHYPNAFGGM